MNKTGIKIWKKNWKQLVSFDKQKWWNENNQWKICHWLLQIKFNMKKLSDDMQLKVS